MAEHIQVQGGLGKITQAKGVGREAQDIIHNRWGTLIDVEIELREAGLNPPDKPKFSRPTLSAEQLTTDVHRDYTTLYAQHLAWFNFTVPMLAHVRAKTLQVVNEMKDIEVETRKQLRLLNKSASKLDKLREIDIEDTVWVDSRYKELIIEKQKLDQFRLELEGYLTTMESNLKVISRQVEIRKIEMGGERTENGMSNRNRFQPPRYSNGE